jgi:hypothetical protein
MDSYYNVRDFGALGNGVDDFPAFQKALDQINTDALSAAGTDASPGGQDNDLGNRGGVLYIPAGSYVLGQTLRITRNVIVQGAGMATSRLIFDKGGADRSSLAGIVVDHLTEKDRSGKVVISQRSDFTVIRDLSVETPDRFYPGATGNPSLTVADDDARLAGTYSGIVVYSPFVSVENCQVAGFVEDGIHVNSRVPAGVTTPRWADCWQVTNCLVVRNGRHGLFVIGGDANVGSARNLTCNGNCRWGISDSSFLGNTYLMCHVEGNGVTHSGPGAPPPDSGGAYRTTEMNARSVFLGCYSEGGQNASEIHWPTLVVGGMHNAGLRRAAGSYDYPNLIQNEGIELNKLRVHGPVALGVGRITGAATPAPTEVTNPGKSVILVDAHTGDLPLVLPALHASGAPTEWVGSWFTIKKADASTNKVSISVPTSASERIDGAATLDLIQTNAWVTLVSDESDWYVIGKG